MIDPAHREQSNDCDESHKKRGRSRPRYGLIKKPFLFETRINSRMQSAQSAETDIGNHMNGKEK